MPRPDTSNAHIRRGGTTRQREPEPSQFALDAGRLLDDPAFIRATETTEESIINLIVDGKHDGSPEFEAAEREMCRTLRTLRSLKRVLTKTLQGEKLRLADFKPREPEKEDY